MYCLGVLLLYAIKRWEQEGCIQKSRFPAGKLKTEDSHLQEIA
jgi:hypothetical protein